MSRGASNDALRGPSLGLMVDPASMSVRQVLGLPGAATYSASTKLPFPVLRVAEAYRGGFALALKQDGLAVVEITASGVQPLANVAPGPDQVVFSPSATTAALYHRGTGIVEIVTGLPANPSHTATLDLSTLPRPATTLAVSDNSVLLAAAALIEDSSAVWVTAPLRPASLVLPGRAIQAMAFLGTSNDALIADMSANQVYRVRDPLGAHSIATIAGQADGISAPVAIAASTDGKQAVVAGLDGAGAVVLDLSAGVSTRVSCDCTVSAADPMPGTAVFRLTGSSAPQMWVLDANSGPPRALFVPPASPATNSGAAAQ